MEVELSRLAVVLTVLVSSLTKGLAQHVCDHCNCQISTELGSHAIHNIGLICNTGTITWYGASGAIRMELTPFVRGHFRACFMAEAENTHIKISQENLSVDALSNHRRKRSETTRTLKLDHLMTSNSRSDEFCVHSESNVPLMLYAEAVRTPGVVGVPKVVFHYDVEKVDSKQMVDTMEECRPCTKEEILDAYCSMDFVVVGSMASLTHDQRTDRTHVHVHVGQVIHQKEPELFRKARRTDPHLSGRVTVPRKCAIKHGRGQFLMTGNVRLGQLALKCSMFLDEWRGIQNEAECSHG